MSTNNINVLSLFTKTALPILRNNTPLYNNCWNVTSDFKNFVNGYGPGASEKIRKADVFTTRSGATYNAQDINEQYTTLTLDGGTGFGDTNDGLYGVDLNVTSVELTTYLTENGPQGVMERFIKPAAVALANKIEKLTADYMMRNIFNTTGTYGSPFGTNAVAFNAAATITSFSGDLDERTLAMTPISMATLANAQATAFNPTLAISKIYEKGILSTDFAGFKTYQSQVLPNWTKGSLAGATATVTNTASNGDSTLTVTISGGSGSTITKGQILVVAGVKPVNIQTKDTFNNPTIASGLAQFVVTANATVVSGAVTLNVSPVMYDASAGSLQNLSALPQSGAVVTFDVMASASGTSFAQNLAFHKTAFCVASPMLFSPTAGAKSSIISEDGFSLRLVEQWNQSGGYNSMRLDTLFGITAGYNQLAVRITN